MECDQDTKIEMHEWLTTSVRKIRMSKIDKWSQIWMCEVYIPRRQWWTLWLRWTPKLKVECLKIEDWRLKIRSEIEDWRLKIEDCRQRLCLRLALPLLTLLLLRFAFASLCFALACFAFALLWFVLALPCWCCVEFGVVAAVVASVVRMLEMSLSQSQSY